MNDRPRRPPRRRSRPQQNLRRLPLGSLRVFVAVAEHLSFTRAAAALGVTVSAASMQIQALEEYLGLPLFRRAGGLVELSAEGAQLLPKIREGLDALQNAIDGARTVRGAGAVRVSMLHSFLLQWLLPRLADFEAQHPDIHLHIESTHEVVDFHKSDMHAAVRFGRGQWPGVHSEKLMDEWLVPVCHPSLLKKHGAVSCEQDLVRYRLLHSTSEPWSEWRTGGGGPDYWPESSAGFDDSAAIVRAAEAGAGLALARWSLVAEEVRNGRLALAGDTPTPYSRCYWFVCLPKALNIKKISAFRDWLQRQAAAHPAP